MFSSIEQKMRTFQIEYSICYKMAKMAKMYLSIQTVVHTIINFVNPLEKEYKKEQLNLERQ